MPSGAMPLDSRHEPPPQVSSPSSLHNGAAEIQAPGIPIASVAKRKGSPCQQENNSQGGKRTRSSGPELPEDIWHDIHSLLPLRDAAQASCVSRAFLCSWRCRPNLTFSKSTMGLKGRGIILNRKNSRTFINIVDQIMENYWGTGIKTFKFEYYGSSFDTCKLNSWLQIAVTTGIEVIKISLYLVGKQEHYHFPCSLLFAGSGGKSIRSLDLRCCTFRPMAGLGCLARLQLCQVHITGDELGCLLSSSFALEELDLSSCNDIICLKIPCLLQRLSKLTVSGCRALEVIVNKAPNLCTVCIDSDVIHTYIGDSLQVKGLEMFCFVEFNLVHHARAKLPVNMPKLETLRITSAGEMFSTPSLPVKFLGLKHLDIFLDPATGAFSPNYDYFSLVHFLDACPMLETFRLGVLQTQMKHDSALEDPSHLRQMSGHRHGNIRKVEIIGFCSAKSMVELACHILENATSLECLTLDTINNYYDCEDAYRLSSHEFGECFSVCRRMIAEAHKALLAIERFVVGKVPSTVKFNVLKPCSRCHVLKSCRSNVIAATIV